MSDNVHKTQRSWLPFLAPVAFFGLFGLLYFMNQQDGRDTAALPSALIGRTAPATILPAVEGLNLPGIDPTMFAGKITLVNVFASWCAPCRDEHPYLTALAKDPRVQLVGLNQRDKPENTIKFLTELGNPYVAVGADNNARASIDWGVYGVPETFLVGPDGVIRYKYTGPINPDIIEKYFMPEIEKLASRS